MNKTIFWIFGALQSLSFSVLIFVIFHSLNTINKARIIGLDTQIWLSILPPLCLLIIEYIIYSGRCK